MTTAGAKKAEPKEKVEGIYNFVLTNAKKTANKISQKIKESSIDQGGIFFVEGPVGSGKSLVAMELKLLFKKDGVLKGREYLFCQPLVDRADVPKNKIFSRAGKEIKAFSFENKQDIEKIFHDHDIVVIDEVQFTPLELQGYLLQEIMMFVERGGWFVGMGLHYTSQEGEFVLTALLTERATEAYKLYALCQMCGRKAYKYNQRFVNGIPTTMEEPELLGPSDITTYEPRCDDCHIVRR